MNPQAEAVLNEIFDVETTIVSEPVSQNTVAEIVQVESTAITKVVDTEMTQAEIEAQEDYVESRKALRAIAYEAQSTLNRAVEVAQQLDTPRNFEAVADLIRANLETHQAIQGLHKTAAEIRIASKTSSGAGTQQVNVDKGIIFNGTPDELLRMIDKTRT